MRVPARTSTSETGVAGTFARELVRVEARCLPQGVEGPLHPSLFPHALGTDGHREVMGRMTQPIEQDRPAILQFFPLIKLLAMAAALALIIRFNPFHWVPWNQMNPNQRMQLLCDIFIVTICTTGAVEAALLWLARRQAPAAAEQPQAAA